MTRRLDHAALIATGEIVSPKAIQADRSFELPPSLHIGLFGIFPAYIGVMAAGFPAPGMAIPVAIFAIFIVAFCAVPAIWPKLASARAKSWSELMSRGLETQSGHASGRETVILVLMLPTFVLLWGVAVVTIAHNVS